MGNPFRYRDHRSYTSIAVMNIVKENGHKKDTTASETLGSLSPTCLPGCSSFAIPYHGTLDTLSSEEVPEEALDDDHCILSPMDEVRAPV